MRNPSLFQPKIIASTVCLFSYRKAMQEGLGILLNYKWNAPVTIDLLMHIDEDLTALICVTEKADGLARCDFAIKNQFYYCQIKIED